MHEDITEVWQWLWLSWQNGHLQYQRSAVRIQSSAKNYNDDVFLFTVEKRKTKKKEAGNFKTFLFNKKPAGFSTKFVSSRCIIDLDYRYPVEWESNPVAGPP